ncbi:MAG: type II toxin-antitoxin system HicA family toxin [Chthoniobacterales bacterium]
MGNQKLPRDLSGQDIAKALQRLGFEIVRQRGSHIRLKHGARRVTVPNHGEVNVRTLSSILDQAGLTIDELQEEL